MSFNYLAENGTHLHRVDSKTHRERSKIVRETPKNVPSYVTYPIPKQVEVVNPRSLTGPPKSRPQPKVCPCQKNTLR
jgi:hypothetical protein